MPGTINECALETQRQGGLSPACHVVFRSCQSEAAGRRGEDVEGESGVGGLLTLVLQKFPISRLPTGSGSGRAEAGRVGGQRRSGKKTGQLEPGPGCIIVFAGFDEILQILFISTQMREWPALICARC